MFSLNTEISLAPALQTARWFNTEKHLTLKDFEGRVVVLIAFQMLCPGCVARSIPLARRVEQTFDRRDLAVVGLHSVFEHHDVMTPDALEVFLAEYRIRFPVAIDSPDSTGTAIPLTMQAYEMQGTPTIVLIDAEGRLRAQYFGTHDDLVLGAGIGALLAERDGVECSDPDHVIDDSTDWCSTEQCTARV